MEGRRTPGPWQYVDNKISACPWNVCGPRICPRFHSQRFSDGTTNGQSTTRTYSLSHTIFKPHTAHDGRMRQRAARVQNAPIMHTRSNTMHSREAVNTVGRKLDKYIREPRVKTDETHALAHTRECRRGPLENKNNADTYSLTCVSRTRPHTRTKFARPSHERLARARLDGDTHAPALTTGFEGPVAPSPPPCAPPLYVAGRALHVVALGERVGEIKRSGHA